MFNKNLDDIIAEDLKLLITNSVQESKYLEYKRELSMGKDKEKKEFLADVSALANTSGGTILFGVEEDRETGFPIEFVNQEIDNEDQLFLKIENLLRDGLEPRIENLQLKSVDVDGKTIIVCKVQKSFNSPHMVKFQSHSKFYIRTNSGKYAMDVHELRNAFVENNSMIENMNSFRINRIGKIISEETMFKLSNVSNVVLHMLPLQSFNSNYNEIDIHKVSKTNAMSSTTRPMCSSGWDSTYNFDGYINYNSNNNNESRTYVQFYRNGIIEAVASNIIYDASIPSQQLEEVLIDSTKKYLKALKILEVNLPVYVSITLTGVKNSTLEVPFYTYDDSIKNYHSTLLIRPILITDYQADISKIMKGSFDQIWNAHGYKKSCFYDDDGNRKSK